MSQAARAREIFEQAIELDSVEARQRFVEQACGGDSELRSAVMGLIDAHSQPTGLLETTDSVPSPPASRVIDGKYKLLQQIGTGGMGEVWMAEQEKPVRRRVAIKLIKPGMDSKLIIARFEAERQALALMDHQHIAKVFDAGATAEGRPFFVMEYVRGKPITRFADDNHLTIPERLELFEQVCSAVQHAHHKGIIHRDLKPTNVLVSAPDGKPVSKVIDFGIAKATSQQLTDMTLFTLHDQLIGTPQYMSPEQAAGSVDIDTRTDVYSLGVILFELLTGTTPFPREELQAAGFEKMKQIIMEKDPPKPSTRISLSAQTIETLAASRRTEPKRLGLLVRGELDWIVMKALDKDRSRRYETPSSFSEDIFAYLNGEPINAAPPGRMYRIQKIVRKNRGQILAAASFLALLLLGLFGTTWGLLRAIRAERTTQSALNLVSKERDAKSTALQAEQVQRARAESQQKIAEVNLVQGIIRPIGAGDKSNELNTSEVQSLKDWSQLPTSRLKLLVLEQALESGDSALRVARRGDYILQACVGISSDRRREVLQMLRQRQMNPNEDFRIPFAACWLEAHFRECELPSLQSVVSRFLESERQSNRPTDDDFSRFVEQFVASANSSAQIRQACDLLVAMVGKTGAPYPLKAAGDGFSALASRLENAQVQPAWDLLVLIGGEYSYWETSEAAGEGIKVLAHRLEASQVQQALDLLVAIVDKTSYSRTLEFATEGFKALSARLEGVQVQQALDSLIAIVRKTDNPKSLRAAGEGFRALASRLEDAQIQQAWDSLVAKVGKTDHRNPLQATGEFLLYLCNLKRSDVATVVDIILVKSLELSAAGKPTPNEEFIIKVAKPVSQPEKLGNLLRHHGARGSMQTKMLRRMDEIAFHDGRPVYSDFRLAELDAEEKKADDSWTEADEVRLSARRDALPPRQIRAIDEAAAWLKVNRPEFDLDAAFNQEDAF